jgi:DNA-directed RNA polymerase subunit F
MEENVTKEDLQQFRLLITNEIRQMLENIYSLRENTIRPKWLKGKVVRKLLDISPGSLQNLRISGKLSFKKLLGTYYYSKEDIETLFDDIL